MKNDLKRFFDEKSTPNISIFLKNHFFIDCKIVDQKEKKAIKLNKEIAQRQIWWNRKIHRLPFLCINNMS